MDTSAVQEFLDKYIDATLVQSVGRWDFAYRPYGDDSYMLYFHTEPTDDGNHTIKAGAFIPQVQEVYFVFEPVEMSRLEAQLALVGHLANTTGEHDLPDGKGVLDELAELFMLREHGLWLRMWREPDYSAEAVLGFVPGWLALHQEPVVL